MKRLFFSLIFAICALCSYAQESHLPYFTFKGIELTPGITVKDISSKLIKNGCKYDDVYSNEDMSILFGTFCNYDTKFMILPCHQNKEMASIITAQLPERESWKQLKADYDNMKSILSQKYFKEVEKEYFDDNYIAESTSDYLKLHALQSDECTFMTRFDIADSEEAIFYGYIVLGISHVYVDFVHHHYVSVSYVTSANVIEQFSSMSDI